MWNSRDSERRTEDWMRSEKLPDLCPPCWKLFQLLGARKITNQLSTPFTSPRATCGDAICAKKTQGWFEHPLINHQKGEVEDLHWNIFLLKGPDLTIFCGSEEHEYLAKKWHGLRGMYNQRWSMFSCLGLWEVLGSKCSTAL